jgi:hypothetical protein
VAGDSIRVSRGQTLTLELDIFQQEEDGARVDITGGELFWRRYTLPTKVEIEIVDSVAGKAELRFTEADTLALVKGQTYVLQLSLRLPADTLVFPEFSIVTA